jgi:hypothetical protein
MASSISRRCQYGRSRTDRPSRWSTSKTISVAAPLPATRRPTRERSWPESGPPYESRHTNSPSRITRLPATASASGRSSGNSAVQSRPGRVRRQSRLPSNRTCRRQPSHLASAIHPSLSLRQRARASEHRLDEARQILARRSRHHAADSTQQGPGLTRRVERRAQEPVRASVSSRRSRPLAWCRTGSDGT